MTDGAPVYDPAVDPVLCSPYRPPDRHWRRDEQGRAVAEPPLLGRREPTGRIVPDDEKDKQGRMNLPLPPSVNKLIVGLRAEVGAWRNADYRHGYRPGTHPVTAVTRVLLHHWTDAEATRLRPFFAQVEAIETLIWLREVARRGHPLRRELEEAARPYNDDIVRVCSKMATGTGKTVVVGMLIAWQTLNAAQARSNRNVKHTDRFAVLTPGHTVSERLRALQPSTKGNIYDEMGLVPQGWHRRALNEARVRVVNYQAFQQRDQITDSDARKALGRHRGDTLETRAATVRRVLGDIAAHPHPSTPVCVINDEAHHCYLPSAHPDQQARKSDDEAAALWFNALRSMRDAGLLGRVTHLGQEAPVYDFSATPIWIGGGKKEPRPFQWVASDFGLMDSIESGLVKVPRVPVDDDSDRHETVWRNIYKHTAPKKLNEQPPGTLPELLAGALEAQVQNWRNTFALWQKGFEGQPQPTPPVLIVVANSVANATVLWEHIAGRPDPESGGNDHTLGRYPELSNIDHRTGEWTLRTLLVHSNLEKKDHQAAIPKPMLEAMRASGHIKTKDDAKTAVRTILNTVGKQGQPGDQIRCVVSVDMLTEGWDARTVTNIVGFRAFGTQLLCEQVTGRALRRTSYESLRPPDAEGRELFEPEYAEVVGIPFDFMPYSDKSPPPPKPPKPRTTVTTLPRRTHLRIEWPHVVGYMRRTPQTRLRVIPERVRRWQQQTGDTPTMALLAGIAGESEIIATVPDNLRERSARLRIACRAVESLHTPNGADEDGAQPMTKSSLFRSTLTAVEEWQRQAQVTGEEMRQAAVSPTLRRLAAEAVLDACEPENDGHSPKMALLHTPPTGDTSAVEFETTLTHILAHPAKSELSHAACHSKLELDTAKALDAHPQVTAWVRNYQLGWTLPYHHNGAWHRYEPDFVARLDRGVMLLIECKGVTDAKAEATRQAVLDDWMPALRGTATLPDGLRRWAYAHITGDSPPAGQLDQAIRAAAKTLPTPQQKAPAHA